MQWSGWSYTCPGKHKALQPPEEATVCATRIQKGIPEARDDAVVALKGRLVMRPMHLPRHQDTRILHTNKIASNKQRSFATSMASVPLCKLPCLTSKGHSACPLHQYTTLTNSDSS